MARLQEDDYTYLNEREIAGSGLASSPTGIAWVNDIQRAVLQDQPVDTQAAQDAADNAQSSADASLKKASNLSDLTDPASARVSLVLGNVDNTRDVDKSVLSSTKLTTARTIAATGDIVWTSPAFDGTGNVTAAATLATVNTNVGTFGSSTAVPVITVDGKGRVTAVTTAPVSGGGSGSVTSVSVTTANGVSGTVANASTTPAITLTLGAITPTSVTATGTVTGSNLSGSNTGDQTTISGNAGTASRWQTPRNLSLTGDVTATLSVDGSADVSSAATLSATGVTAGSYTNASLTVDAKGRLTSVSNGSAGGTGTVTSVSVTTANGVSGTVTNSTTTPAISLTLGGITPSSVVASGTVTGSNLSGTNTGDQTTITGNAGTATKWATARTLSFTGDAAGSGSVDGSANVATGLTLATVNSTTGTFGSGSSVPVVTVNAKGLVTSVTTTPVSAPASLGFDYSMSSTGANATYYYTTSVATTIAERIRVGTATVTYAKSTAAAPTTFNTVTLPTSLEAGASLRTILSTVTSLISVSLYRTA